MTVRTCRWAVFTLALAIVLVAACGQATPPGAPPATAPSASGTPTALTVDEVYRRVERTLRQPGRLYHATVRVEADAGFFASTAALERWVDASRDVAREEGAYELRAAEGPGPAGRPAGRTDRRTALLTASGQYVREPDGQVRATSIRLWTCHGVGIAASVVLGCPGPTEQSTATVERGQHDGKPAVVLVTAGTSRGSDETFTFTNRLYLDPDTFLPVSMEGAGQVDMGQIKPTRERRTYAHEFVAAGDVPADFFDPGALGYREPDPAGALDRVPPDLAVYWLGERFPGTAGLPPLTLQQVVAADPARGPGYAFLLHYARADDPHGPPVAALELWSRASWERYLAQSKEPSFWKGPCWSRRELTLPGGGATIFAGPAPEAPGAGRPPPATPGACPAGEPERFLAQADLGQTVVRVSAPGVGGPGGTAQSPYDTREGIEALVRGLRPRGR